MMMSKPLLILAACALLAGISASALAAEKKKSTKPPGAQQVQSGTVSVALTGDECIALGGKVGTFQLCTSGQACSFTDQNQVKHEMCVTKAAK